MIIVEAVKETECKRIYQELLVYLMMTSLRHISLLATSMGVIQEEELPLLEVVDMVSEAL
jgi:hypothetical protein